MRLKVQVHSRPPRRFLVVADDHWTLTELRQRICQDYISLYGSSLSSMIAIKNDELFDLPANVPLNLLLDKTVLGIQVFLSHDDVPLALLSTCNGEISQNPSDNEDMTGDNYIRQRSEQMRRKRSRNSTSITIDYQLGFKDGANSTLYSHGLGLSSVHKRQRIQEQRDNHAGDSDNTHLSELNTIMSPVLDSEYDDRASCRGSISNPPERLSRTSQSNNNESLVLQSPELSFFPSQPPPPLLSLSPHQSTPTKSKSEPTLNPSPKSNSTNAQSTSPFAKPSIPVKSLPESTKEDNASIVDETEDETGKTAQVNKPETEEKDESMSDSDTSSDSEEEQTIQKSTINLRKRAVSPKSVIPQKSKNPEVISKKFVKGNGKDKNNEAKDNKGQNDEDEDYKNLNDKDTNDEVKNNRVKDNKDKDKNNKNRNNSNENEQDVNDKDKGNKDKNTNKSKKVTESVIDDHSLASVKPNKKDQVIKILPKEIETPSVSLPPVETSRFYTPKQLQSPVTTPEVTDSHKQTLPSQVKPKFKSKPKVASSASSSDSSSDSSSSLGASSGSSESESDSGSASPLDSSDEESDSESKIQKSKSKVTVKTPVLAKSSLFSSDVVRNDKAKSKETVKSITKDKESVSTPTPIIFIDEVQDDNVNAKETVKSSVKDKKPVLTSTPIVSTDEAKDKRSKRKLTLKDKTSIPAESSLILTDEVKNDNEKSQEIKSNVKDKKQTPSKASTVLSNVVNIDKISSIPHVKGEIVSSSKTKKTVETDSQQDKALTSTSNKQPSLIEPLMSKQPTLITTTSRTPSFSDVMRQPISAPKSRHSLSGMLHSQKHLESVSTPNPLLTDSNKLQVNSKGDHRGVESESSDSSESEDENSSDQSSDEDKTPGKSRITFAKSAKTRSSGLAQLAQGPKTSNRSSGNLPSPLREVIPPVKNQRSVVTSGSRSQRSVPEIPKMTKTAMTSR